MLFKFIPNHSRLNVRNEIYFHISGKQEFYIGLQIVLLVIKHTTHGISYASYTSKFSRWSNYLNSLRQL